VGQTPKEEVIINCTNLMIVMNISKNLASSLSVRVHGDITPIIIISKLAYQKVLLLLHQNEVLLPYLLDHELVAKFLVYMFSICMIHEPLLMRSIQRTLLQEGVGMRILIMKGLIQ
jgi:hypothetical protein